MLLITILVNLITFFLNHKYTIFLVVNLYFKRFSRAFSIYFNILS
jgi:hypothetical protein